MKTKIKLLTLLSAGIIILACNDINEFIPDTSNKLQIFPATIQTDFKDLESNLFEFQFDPGFGARYIFPDGSIIEFGPNIFWDNGNPVTCGLVDAKIKMVQKQSEMVQNLVGTNGDNKQILISGGMVYVQVFCNNTELQLAPNKNYTLKLVYDPNQFNDDFEMFYGEEKDNQLNWIEADKDPNTQNNVTVSEWQIDSNTRLFQGLLCFPERLKWVNCDYFLKLSGVDKTEPCLIATTPPTGDHIKLISFCVFKNLNTVISPCCNVSSTGSICFSPLPIGSLVEYVIIGKGKTKYYYGSIIKPIEINEVTTINLDIVTLTEIKDKISKL